MNITTGLEAISLRHKVQEVEVGPLSAVVKVSLPPLWKALPTFVQARLVLRRVTPSRCYLNGQRPKHLLLSSSFFV